MLITDCGPLCQPHLQTPFGFCRKIYGSFFRPFSTDNQARGRLTQIDVSHLKSGHLPDPQTTAKHECEHCPVADIVNRSKIIPQLVFVNGAWQPSWLTKIMPLGNDRACNCFAFRNQKVIKRDHRCQSTVDRTGLITLLKLEVYQAIYMFRIDFRDISIIEYLLE